MAELEDEGCPKSIRDFVRNNPDVEVYDYIRRGCNGEVYFGKRNKMGDDVVLKFYWSQSNFDATEEAVILKSINHPNILKIYDVRFLAPDFSYFLTPKISGGDLQGIIDRGNVSTKEALNIIAGILLGLTELHSAHQLVHRDLKPGNVLIELEGNKPVIADLGAVKKIDLANGHVTASKSTYLYLPPEAIIRNEYYYQSDIYQVGLILFQLLNGFFPINEPLKWFTRREEDQFNKLKTASEKNKKFDEVIANKIVKGKLVDNATLPYYIDASFKKVLNIALNPKHGSRYKNTSLFLKDIHHLLRINPEYIMHPDCLYVKHETGKQYKIFIDSKGNPVIEKCISNDSWRKDNNHAGTIESVLKLARRK